ncbi:hypothetical protein [Acidobacterium sp. S8]|nr:hypothetical protein [Acidobacterium sp. S8]
MHDTQEIDKPKSVKQICGFLLTALIAVLIVVVLVLLMFTHHAPVLRQ